MVGKRRLVAVTPHFDPVPQLTIFLTNDSPSIRIAGIYGLSRHASEARVRLALKMCERDVNADVRLAAKRVLNGFSA